MEIAFHHSGCLVENIDEALQDYEGIAQLGDSVRIADQKVRVGLVEFPDGSFLELVEPDEDNSFLRRLLKRSVSVYHAGYLCDDLKAAEARFVDNGARVLVRFASELFDGRQCVFILTRSGQMIELIERDS